MALLPVVAEVEPVAQSEGAEGGDVYKQGSVFRIVLRTFTKNKLAVAGVVIVVGMLLFSFVGPLFYHTDQVDTNIIESNLRPSGSHLLGTDNNGYDILGRLMAGGQISIEVGLSVAFIATFLGVVSGRDIWVLRQSRRRGDDASGGHLPRHPRRVPFHFHLPGNYTHYLVVDHRAGWFVLAGAGSPGARRDAFAADP